MILVMVFFKESLYSLGKCFKSSVNLLFKVDKFISSRIKSLAGKILISLIS